MSNVIDAIKKRSSTRGYTPEPLTDTELGTLLHAVIHHYEEGSEEYILDYPPIAVENMALAAEDLGLGNLIIGCIYDALRGEKKDYFAKALRFPEQYEYEIAIAFGHKAVTKEPHTYDLQTQVTFL